MGLKVARRVGAGRGSRRGGVRFRRNKGALKGATSGAGPLGGSSLKKETRVVTVSRPGGDKGSRKAGKMRLDCAGIPPPGFQPPILPRSPRPSPAREQPAGDNRRPGSRAPTSPGVPPPSPPPRPAHHDQWAETPRRVRRRWAPLPSRAPGPRTPGPPSPLHSGHYLSSSPLLDSETICSPVP